MQLHGGKVYHSAEKINREIVIDSKVIIIVGMGPSKRYLFDPSLLTNPPSFIN